MFNLFIWRLNTHTLSPRNLDVAGGLEVLGNLVNVVVSIHSAECSVCVGLHITFTASVIVRWTHFLAGCVAAGYVDDLRVPH